MSIKLVSVCRSVRHFSTSVSRNKKQVCIVGSGPAGFYCAQHLTKVVPEVQVDIYEKLPVPFGLVRYGVAPDHQDVKNCINSFTKTAHRNDVAFFGNVTLGRDISFAELQQAYHAVILAYGCSEEKLLGIPGEDLPHVHGARKLVAWYNGHPDDVALKPDLSGDCAVILGQGNVAIDVARILLSPIDDLRKTDIPEQVLSQLSESKIKQVYLVGRRGPLQAAFTIKEFREMTKLPGVSVKLSQSDIMSKLQPYLSDVSRPRKRLTELMIKTWQDTQGNEAKTFNPLFFRKPKQVKSNSVSFTCTSTDDLLNGKVVDTDRVEEVDAQLVVRSIGYSGLCVDKDIPFNNQTNTISDTSGVYGVGWISNGPTGVILQTMNLSFRQADNVAKYLLSADSAKPGSQFIKQVLDGRGVSPVSFEEWEKVDKEESERGSKLGKPREKILDIDEMLKIAKF